MPTPVFCRCAGTRARPFRVADLRGNVQNVELAMHGLDILAGHHPNDLGEIPNATGPRGQRQSGDEHTTPERAPHDEREVHRVAPGGPSEGLPTRGAQGAEFRPERPGGWKRCTPTRDLKRAWIADEITVLEDDEAALARILSQDFDPGREAVLADAADLVAPAVGGGSGSGARHTGSCSSRTRDGCN